MNLIAQVPIGESFKSPFGQSLSLGNLISLVLSASFALAGLLVLFLLIFAGFQIVTSAGQDNPEAAAKGKQAATAAVLGFVLIFVAYWIVRIIELITGISFITAPGF